MTTIKATTLACGIAVLALGSASPLHAQIEVGTWVRQPIPSMPGMTMTVEACCSGGRRLTYLIAMDTARMVLTIESPFDGSDAPVFMGGKPTGETMAITRLDDHHVSAVLKLNGKFFGTAKGTLSADGKTLTVLNDYTSAAGGYPVGKYTEVWVRK